MPKTVRRGICPICRCGPKGTHYRHPTTKWYVCQSCHDKASGRKIKGRCQTCHKVKRLIHFREKKCYRCYNQENFFRVCPRCKKGPRLTLNRDKKTGQLICGTCSNKQTGYVVKHRLGTCRTCLQGPKRIPYKGECYPCYLKRPLTQSKKAVSK